MQCFTPLKPRAPSQASRPIDGRSAQSEVTRCVALGGALDRDDRKEPVAIDEVDHRREVAWPTASRLRVGLGAAGGAGPTLPRLESRSDVGGTEPASHFVW